MKQIKKVIFVGFLSVLFGNVALAQMKNFASVNIIVNDIASTDKKIDTFLHENNMKTTKYNKSKYYLEIQLTVDSLLYQKLAKEYRTWGYISNENSSLTANQSEIEKLREHVIQLEKEKLTYQSLATYSDSTAKRNYPIYVEKIIEIDKLIYNDEIKMKDLESGSQLYYVEIKMTEEVNSTMDYSSSWVNMPGLEYSQLWIEQPETGVTPSLMQGVSLKYMFNTGKSYGVLGLYKNVGEKTKINEVYLVAFGQDFYSRRMGRGQRKFLNLYTSFNAGVYVLTGEEKRSASWFINPFLGVEIFKNKYFLIDNKVGYFLPYQDNRNMRGLLYNFSFNFVF